MHRFLYRLAMLWLAMWVGSSIGVSLSVGRADEDSSHFTPVSQLLHGKANTITLTMQAISQLLFNLTLCPYYQIMSGRICAFHSSFYLRNIRR